MAHVAIVGAGPAGAVLGYLLARNGIRVTLLERHDDFRREFRGEVLMPSALEPFAQMGLWDELVALPQVVLGGARVYLDRRPRVFARFETADFGPYLPRWVSQPALLEMLVARAAHHPTFTLLRGASVGGLVEAEGRCVGVRYRREGVEHVLEADLVVGADGRGSVVRRRAGLVDSRDALPMDVVWCRLPMFPGFRETPHLRAYVDRGHLLIVAPSYGDHTQIGWVIAKGHYAEVRARGIEQCLDEMANHVDPEMATHLRASRDAVSDPFLLATVADRVERWSAPGLLVIGDAAHTCSPVGAQGINLAVRDAVEAANRLVPVLGKEAAPAALDAATAAIQRIREPEIREVQRGQALPPRILFSRGAWGRWLLRALVPLAGGERRARRNGRLFARLAFGVTDVRVAV